MMSSGWDVDSLCSAYALTPDRTDDGCDGGLSPDGDGGGAAWQDDFFRLESLLLDSISARPAAQAPAAEPPRRPRPPPSRKPAPAPLLHLPSGAANLQPLPASALPPPPPHPCQVTYRGHGLAGSTSSSDGQTSADMGNGVNMDKRRCRQLNRDDFMAAIAQFRAQQAEQAQAAADLPSAAQAPPSLRRGMSGTTIGLGSVRGWVRKRPLLPHEAAKGEYDAVSVEQRSGGGEGGGGGTLGGHRGSHITTHCCLLKPDLRRMFIRHSTFSPNGGVLNEHATSDDAYAAFGADLVQLALSGGRGTLLMYGQTGSGKTMTISHLQTRAAQQLFGGGADDGAGGGCGPVAAAVEVTAVEVAGRSCRDLHTGAACTVLQTKSGGATLKGAKPFVAQSGRALSAHLERVLKSRTTEATAANSTSSRSHALITLRVGIDGGAEGRLTLLDCAGSEWSADSDAHDAKRRKEGAEINASLHALKQCVRAQAEKARTGKGHVPYRDQVLTRLLRDSFEADGLDCRLAMVGCVSPGAADCEHTTSTLRCVMELSSAKASAEECTASIQQVPRLRSLAAAAERTAAAAAATAAAQQWASVGANHLVERPRGMAAAAGEREGKGETQAAVPVKGSAAVESRVRPRPLSLLLDAE